MQLYGALPQVVFRVKVTYDSRNDLAFTMGVADKPYATTPTVTLKSAIAANQGGDHPMQGQYSDDNSIELAFDFTGGGTQIRLPTPNRNTS